MYHSDLEALARERQHQREREKEFDKNTAQEVSKLWLSSRPVYNLLSISFFSWLIKEVEVIWQLQNTVDNVWLIDRKVVISTLISV